MISVNKNRFKGKDLYGCERRKETERRSGGTFELREGTLVPDRVPRTKLTDRGVSLR